MKFEKSYTIAEIASLLGLSYKGSENIQISGINEIHRHNPGDLVFVDFHKYYDRALNSNAAAVIIDQEVSFPAEKGIIISKNPFRDFNFLLNYFKPFQFPDLQKEADCRIGANSQIHSSVSIGKNVTIGRNCLIFPNVSILDDVEIGDQVIIQSGSVIGSMGFYYKNRKSHYERLFSVGKVIIENEVEIGSNCSIDRGVTAATVIGEGSKIDNLVQIGHDSIIGKHCILAAQSGIAGCVTIEDYCTIWGQVGIASGLHIGKKSIIGAQSGVSKSLKGEKTYVGTPAEEIDLKYREQVLLRKMRHSEHKKPNHNE